ncbi:MAG TPA: oligosaccharide flippase family protein, partial [Acidimicrobiia bacterium]|nr:oligosaccharide flippase family protein [Acidimicrobiia bacterium]
MHGHDAACAHHEGRDDLRRLGIVLSIGRLVGGAAALGWTVFAAAKLQQDWGRLATVLAYASVASVFTDLGIPLALTQLSCRHGTLDRAVVYRAIRTRAAIGSIAAIVLVLAWDNTSSANGRWGLAALYGISVTVTPITGSFLALLRGRAVGVVEACYEAGRQLALPALGIAIIQLGLGIFGVLALYVTIDVIGSIAVFLIARKRLGITNGDDATERHEMELRETVPLSATTIVGNAYERVDSALLAPLAGTAAVGVYRMISPLIGAVLMPARAFGDAAAVGAGRAAPHQQRATVKRFAARALVVTVPLAALIAWLGPAVLSHLLQAHRSIHNPHPIDWNTARVPIRVLAVTAIPTAILATLTPVAVLARRDRVFGYALLALVLNVVLNVVLVPAWGADLGASGAAIAFLLTESMLCVVLWL